MMQETSLHYPSMRFAKASFDVALKTEKCSESSKNAINVWKRDKTVDFGKRSK